MDHKNLERYLNSFGKQVVEKAKANLTKDKGDTALAGSIRYDITKEFDVKFFMNSYGTFVDKGVKGAGGEIKSGKHKGTWGGRRYYTTWEGQRKDSPYKFGSGKSSGSIYKGIGSFIRKKGLQPRSEGGQYMTTVGLKIAIVKVLWIKGIHGISFFQKPFGFAMKDFDVLYGQALRQDIEEALKIKK
mgnify:CR=1 FL=1